MVLTVYERLLLRNIIPQIQGWNFAYMKEARELMEGLFTPEEEDSLKITLDGEAVKWRTLDDDGNSIPQEKEIIISKGLQSKIADFLKRLDSQEKLSLNQYSIYVKFVEPAS